MKPDLTPDDALFEGPALVPGMDMMDTLHLLQSLDEETGRDHENGLDAGPDPDLARQRALAVQASNDATRQSLDRVPPAAAPSQRKPGPR